MKRSVVILSLFIALISLFSSHGLDARATTQPNGKSMYADSTTPLSTGSGMPGWPVPDKPIPQHNPGEPSRATNYTTQTIRSNSMGVEEIVQLTGLDAMTADGLDPLAGSYRLVGKDDIALGVYDIDDYSIDLKTYQDTSIDLVADSAAQLAPAVGSRHQSFDLAAGDLNGDGVDEQLAAWVDAETHHIMLAIGEMPGTDGRSSSEPAAAAFGDQIDLLVRGYDQALWHAHYNGTDWEPWNNDGGGLMLSGPALASRGGTAFEVIAVGTDNQIYQRHWNGTAWGGSWAGLPVDAVFSAQPAWVGPMPELPAPAAVARSVDQLDVFRLAPDRTLRWSHFNGSSWSSWESLGGMLAYGPGALLLDDNSLQVFAIGVDQSLWYLHSAGAGWEMDGSTYHWQRVALEGIDPGVKPISAPSAVQLPGGQVRVFMRGSDDALWQVTYAGTWGIWSKGGAGLASRPAAAVRSSGLILFGLTAAGSLQRSLDGTTWGDLEDHPWLPACCLGSPIDTGLYAYTTSKTNPVDQLNLLDVETGHFLGDSRQQIALAYTWADPGNATRSGIGLLLFDVNDGFTTLNMLGQIDDLQHEEDYYPKLAVGEFDGDAPQEIALAFATRRGGVRVYRDRDYTGLGIAWLKEGVYHLYVDYPYGSDMHNAISSIQVAPGWEACVYENDPPTSGGVKCFTESDTYLIDDYYENTGELINNTISSVVVTAPEVGANNIFVDVTDGVYNQGNAHVVVEIFDIDPQAPTPVSQALDYFELVRTDIATDDYYDYGDYPSPERTLGIVAGDFDGTRNTQGQLTDEIALIWDKVNWESTQFIGFSTYDACFRILDVETEAAGMNISAHSDFETNDYHFSGFDVFTTRYPESAEINLTVGDFDRDGRDEIARTWPRGFYSNVWSHLFRNLEVLDWDSGWSISAPIQFSGASAYNYEDDLAAGDLNRDMRDEIVYFYAASGDDVDMLLTYYFTPTAGITNSLFEFEAIPNDNFLVLATGDFTGESLRVGPPSYRRQYDVGQVIAVVNAPPKHEDIIAGMSYNLNADDDETYSKFEQVNADSTEVSVTTHKDWGVDSEFKLTIGDPQATHVTTSLENSYGENFEQTGSSTQSLTYNQTIRATTDDALFYTRLAYDVWEYPVYDSLTNAPQGFMNVVWPFGEMDDSKVEPANSCDGWYTPNHQLMNVWSYPSRPEQLLDRDVSGINDLHNVTEYTIGTEQVDFSVAFSNVSVESRSHQYEMGFASSFESQIGGEEIEVNLEVVKFKTRLPSMFFSSRGEYNYSEQSQWTTETTEATTLSGYFSTIPDGNNYRYDVGPYLYWSENDYLVLDYVTAPTGMAFWSSSGANYNKPDPAFILPWAEGQCNHLWPDASYFSSDISIDPPMARAGDWITITATIHNFSEVGNGKAPFNQAFKVSFYQGDPNAGGRWIGESNILAGALKPRSESGAITRSIQWQAQGSGEQHIYAVIDPQSSLAEVHDEQDAYINNNKGYGVLTLDTIEFIDVGQTIDKAYQDITFLMGEPTPLSTLYIPLSNWTENVRIDMLAVDQFPYLHSLGTPFEIAAYQSDWENPEPNFSFTPNEGNPPAVLTIAYANAELTGYDESLLQLYRLSETSGPTSSMTGDVSIQASSNWVSATCGGFDIVRFPEDDLLVVPICQTGTFVLSDQQPVMQWNIYLPLAVK